MSRFFSSRPRVWAAAGGLALAGLGCTEPFAPADFAGLYVLTAVNDVPAPLTAAPGFVIVTDSLELDARGRGSFISIRDLSPVDGPPLPLVRLERDAIVTRRAGATWLDVTCHDGTDCSSGPAGRLRLVANGLVLGESPTALTFRRAEP